MTGWRRWLTVFASLVVLGALVLLVLPVGVRVLAERRLAALTGREVTIGDVDLDLFRRRLVATDVRVHAGPGQPAPLTLARLTARVRWLPLLQGRAELERLALAGLDVYLERTRTRRFNVSDIVEHYAARPAGAPLQVVVDTLLVTGGRIRLHDHAVDPDRDWVLHGLALEAHDVATVAADPRGSAAATFVLAGAPGSVRVQGLGLRPLRGRATVALEGFEIGGLGAYVPETAPVTLSGGRLTMTLTLARDAGGALTADGQARLRETTLARPGQAPPFISAPLASLTVREVRYADGTVLGGRVEATADRLTVLDAGAPRPRPLDVTALHASWDLPADAAVSAGGRLALGAGLPEGGRLVARGTARPRPAAADLEVELEGIDLALARTWIPADGALEPAGGQLAGTLRLRYADGALVAGGRLRVKDLALAPAGQEVAVVRDEQVLARIRDAVVRDGRLALGRVEITASPTAIDASGATPRTLRLPALSLVAEGGAVPGGPPVRLGVQASLPHGGRLDADGTGTLAPASLALAVRAEDADLALARPWIPARSPIALQAGRLDARLSVGFDGALRTSGRLVARGLTLLRRGHDEPFIHHPSLDVAITGLVLRDGRLAIERVALGGAPTIVDSTASPPQRFDVQRLALAITDFTWPGRQPARLQGALSLVNGGRGELSGTLDPATLATDVRARFEDVNVTRVAGYLPPGVPLAIEQGRAAVAVRLRHRRADGVRLDAEGTMTDAAVRVTAGSGLRVSDEHITFRMEDLVIRDGAGQLEAAAVEGSPAIGASGEPAPPLARLAATLGTLHWPGGAPAPWRVVAEPEGGGRVEAQGTLTARPWTVAGTLQADDVSLRPVAALLPGRATVAGTLQARLRGEAGADVLPTVEGEVTLRQLRVGPADAPPIRVERVEMNGLALNGRRLTADRIALHAPRVVLEREADGSFPLRAMLAPAPGAASAGPRDAGAGIVAGGDAPDWQASVRALVVQDGSLRFIDRATRPFYSEELSRLSLRVTDLSTVDDRPATVEVQGVVGVDAALDLAGQIAPFASPFFVDVRGELRDFAVPRTNPLLQRFLDWIARRGELTTRVHYRIVGDQLTATNEVVVQRLDVERAPGDDGPDRQVGLPLGLVVALLKDTRGEIHVTVPVRGDLGAPRFSFGEAVRTAFRNALGRLVTAPLRAIGSVLRRDGAVDGVAVDPVGFAPGSAVLTPDAAAHLQRVADFLRARPYVRLTLEPVVGAEDLRALRTQEAVARIQRAQRAHGVHDFAAAAERVWRQVRPGEAPPEDARAIVRALAAGEPVPVAAARELAERRASVTRTHLIEAAGIPRDRLPDAPRRTALGADGEGRVEFDLRPAS